MTQTPALLRTPFFLMSLCALLAAGGMRASAEHLTADGGVGARPRYVLVELFTSEGCSSCPPADLLLRELNGQHTKDGATVIALGEHVTYWDYLGWRDRYDGVSFDRRQEAYRERFGKDGVYTPQMVINGESEAVGSNRAAVQRALQQIRNESDARLEVSSVVRRGDKVHVTYRLTGRSAAGADVFMAVVQDALPMRVTRGENSGATLAHASVARSLVHAGNRAGQGGEAELPNGTLALGAGAPPAQVVVFAQRSGLGPVLAVATVSLDGGTLQAGVR